MKVHNLDKIGTVEFWKKWYKTKGESNGFNALGETLGEEGTRRRFISASFWIASGSIEMVCFVSPAFGFAFDFGIDGNLTKQWNASHLC